jgi:histidinol-phosphate aminotransferase
MTSKRQIFKPHIQRAQLELNAKAGRTREEILSEFGIDSFHKMSSNENALGPSPAALEAVRKVLGQLHEYDFRTDDTFRHALAEHFRPHLTDEQFITTNSGLEMIELSMQGFLDPGDEVVISNPTFHVYEIFAEVSGARVIDVPLDEDDYTLRVDEVLKAIGPKTKMVILANPNNPTGVAIDKASMDRFMDEVPEDIVVVVDEVYYHFHDLPEFPYAWDYVNQGKNVIGIHSFSKAYGLAGIRLAYGYSTPEIAGYLQKLRRPFFINTMTMVAGMAALNDEEHIQQTQEMVRAGRKVLYPAFDALGLRYWPSHTNFILVKPEGDHFALIERLMRRGVLVRSGDNNGAPGTIRITIGNEESNLALVEALKQELGANKG